MTKKELILNISQIPFSYINDDLVDYYFEEFGERIGIDSKVYKKLLDFFDKKSVSDVNNLLSKIQNELKDKYSEVLMLSNDIGVDKNNFNNEEEGAIVLAFYIPYSIFYNTYKDDIKIYFEKYFGMNDEDILKFLSFYLFKEFKNGASYLKNYMKDYYDVLVEKFGISKEDIHFNDDMEIMFFRVSLKNIDLFKKAIADKTNSTKNIEFDVFKVVKNNVLYNFKSKKLILPKHSDIDINPYELKKLINEEINDNDRLLKCKDYIVKIIE
jgi:hypothetical protein